MTRTFLNLTVGVMVVFGLAGTARTTSAEPDARLDGLRLKVQIAREDDE